MSNNLKVLRNTEAVSSSPTENQGQDVRTLREVDHVMSRVGK